MEKEKYLDYIYEVKGKKYWKSDVKGRTYEDIFDADPKLAWELIYDDKRNIGLFTERFLSKHSDMVEYVIDSVFEITYQTKSYSGREYLEALPYGTLYLYYNKVRKWMELDGMLLSIVPYKLQEDFVQIPMEAVTNNPKSIYYASEKALLKYPDISLQGLKSDWDIYGYLPKSVKEKYNF